MESRIVVRFTGDSTDVRRQLQELTGRGHRVDVVFRGETSQVIRDANGIESRRVTQTVEFRGNTTQIDRMRRDVEGTSARMSVRTEADSSSLGRLRGTLSEVGTGVAREIGANLIDSIGNALKGALSGVVDIGKFSMEKTIERQNLLLASSVAYKGNMEASGKAIKESIDYANRTPFKTQAVGAADTSYKLATGQSRSKEQREEILS
jgi:hypothetical protein